MLILYSHNSNNSNNNISLPWIRYEKTKVVSKCSNPGNDNYPLRPLLPGIKIRAREREKRRILFPTSYLCKIFLSRSITFSLSPSISLSPHTVLLLLYIALYQTYRHTRTFVLIFLLFNCHHTFFTPFFILSLLSSFYIHSNCTFDFTSELARVQLVTQKNHK